MLHNKITRIQVVFLGLFMFQYVPLAMHEVAVDC